MVKTVAALAKIGSSTYFFSLSLSLHWGAMNEFNSVQIVQMYE